jgi:hypothetical protein
VGIERKERENVGAPTFLRVYTPLFLRKQGKQRSCGKKFDKQGKQKA